MKVVIGPQVRIGANARIGHGVTIAGDTGKGFTEGTGIPVIGDDVTIALDSIVLGSVTIGDGALIAAQSLVLHDVPARSVARGSPAKVVRSADHGQDLTEGGPG